jgi:hypothetical protein
MCVPKGAVLVVSAIQPKLMNSIYGFIKLTTNLRLSALNNCLKPLIFSCHNLFDHETREPASLRKKSNIIVTLLPYGPGVGRFVKLLNLKLCHFSNL